MAGIIEIWKFWKYLPLNPSGSEFMAFLENYKLMMIPVYKITKRGLVGIGYQWLLMITNNLLIDYQCTIIALTRFLPIMIGINWQKQILYFTLATETMHS